MAAKKIQGIPYHLWNPSTDMDEFLKYLGLGATMIVRGDGPYLYNQHGKRLINGASCVWNMAIGHGREELVQAAAEQMSKLAFSGCWYQANVPALKLAAKLVEITPAQYQRVYLGTSGTEAVETAFKMARQYHRQSPDPADHGRYKIVSLRGAYHGFSFGAVSAAGSAQHEEKFGPLIPGFVQIEPPYCYRCPYGEEGSPGCGLACAHALQQKVEAEGPESVAAFIVEPIMGDFGIVHPPDEYYRIVGETCRRYGLLFIVDEVSTGFGRTGRLFASEDWDPQPDIMCLAKAISSAYLPLSATLATDAIYERFHGADQHFEHGSTYSGHPVCAAVGLAAIDIILREALTENSAQVGAYLKAGIADLMEKRPIIGDVRGRGLMVGMEFVKDRASRKPMSDESTFDLVIGSMALGLIISFRANILRLLPPLIVDEAIAGDIVRILKKATDQRMLSRMAVKSRLVPELAKSLLG